MGRGSLRQRLNACSSTSGTVSAKSARALPTGTFPVRSFKAKNVLIRLSGNKGFVGGGFRGLSTWDVVFNLRQSRASSRF